MRDFFNEAKRLFARLDTIENRLSIRWREHSNRRTTVVLLCIAALSVFTYIYYISPPDEFPIDQLVTVADGESVKDIGKSLQEQQVIRSPFMFKLLLIAFGRQHVAHAGDYLFKEPLDVWTVSRAISTGAYGLEPSRLRIPEGATTKEMSVLFSLRLQRFVPDRFIQKAQPLEGYLFPDTYYFLPNASDQTVIDTMKQNFDAHIEPLSSAIASSTHSLDEIITLASILEREARTTVDRKMISGVLWNRLAKKMPLQVDATFLYTLGKGTFDLTITDLRTDSPYNTYTNKGLPPTPIGSPSMDSILAALYPTKNDYIYYLADRHGVTYYSKTYDEHLRKKHLYLGS